MVIQNFNVVRRNFGHWDIYGSQSNGNQGRLFRIRGGPSDYKVIDERDSQVKKDILTFKTVGACMSYICDEMMFELIIVDGQQPVIIESWNI